MNCKFCNVSNPEDAVFCKNCGRRLDGIIICRSCGKQSEADAKYCNYCGAALQREEVAAPQPAAVVALQPEVVAAVRNEMPAPAGNGEKLYKKILCYVAEGMAILTSLFALIFVFLIGQTLTVGYDGSVISETQDIYYYFGKFYKDLKELKTVYTSLNYSTFSADSLITQGVFGTIISALTLLSVFGFSVAAIIISSLHIAGKYKKSGLGFSLAAFMSYVVGASLLLAVVGASIADTSVSATVENNGATTTGIALCAVFAAIGVGVTTAIRGKELLNAKALTNCIFSLVIVVIVCVAFGLAVSNSVKVDSMDCKINPIYIVSIISGMCLYKEIYIAITNAEAVAVLGACAFFAVCLTAVFAAFVIAGNAKRISGNKRNTLWCNIALVVAAVAALTLTVVGTQQINVAAHLYNEAANDVTFSYAALIVTLVLSVIALIAEIVRMLITAPAKPADENTAVSGQN